MSTLNCDPSILSLRLGGEDRNATLAELNDVAGHLCSALLTLSRELASDQDLTPRFEVVDARMGSLALAVRPVFEAGTDIEPETVLQTFVSDLEGIRADKFRPGLSTEQVRRYRSLVRCPREGSSFLISHGGATVLIDEQSKKAFESALRGKLAVNVSVVGTIESVNVHKRPYRFSLYTKLTPKDRVECLFPDDMLEAVTLLLRDQALVEVTGEGRFAPAGFFPLRLEVQRPLTPLSFSADALLAYVQSRSLVPPGRTVEDVIDENRERAGIAD